MTDTFKSLFFATPVKKIVDELEVLGFAEDKEFVFSFNITENILDLGVQKEGQESEWLVRTQLSPYNNVVIRNETFQLAKTKSFSFLNLDSKKSLVEQINLVRLALDNFMGYKVPYDGFLKFVTIQKELLIDYPNSWHQNSAITFIDSTSRYASTRRNLLADVLKSDKEPHRATSLLVQGVPLQLVEDLWDLPDSWVLKTNEPNTPLELNTSGDEAMANMIEHLHSLVDHTRHQNMRLTEENYRLQEEKMARERTEQSTS